MHVISIALIVLVATLILGYGLLNFAVWGLIILSAIAAIILLAGAIR